MNTIAGTPYFIAPEVLNGEYNQECDVWSLGIVLYVTMTGKYPFDGNSREEVFSKIQTGMFDTSEKLFRNTSSECVDLIKKMLIVDRNKRIRTNKLLDHKWFKTVLKKSKLERLTSEEAMDTEVVKSLREFKGSSKLKKAVLNSLVKMLKPKDIEHLK